MTALRVLYVEDDPALRGILATVLDARADLSVVAAVGSSDAALAAARDHDLDVALLDLALGEDERTGIELGIELRALHPAIGIVILSQHRVPGFLARMGEGQRKGWSFILKRADVAPQYLSDVLHSTVRGLNVIDPEMVGLDGPDARLALARLSPRQREIMGLAAEGLDAPTIASRIGSSAAAVRQELSRSYQVLVPDPPAGADLRTLAVLRYVREARNFDGRGHDRTP